VADIYRVMADNPVVSGAASGPRELRFEALYAAHHPHVFGYVMRRCERPDDAADAIAETFLVAWRRLDDAPSGEQLRLWLYGVARRVLANQRRGERRRVALADRLRSDLAVHSLTSPASDAATNNVDRLRAALSTLSPNDRELLTLEAWEELSSQQIAKVLACSSAAARTRLHRARRRLQRALEQQYESAHELPQPRAVRDTDRPEAIEGGS
jgi:RNA polymerase sigma factor (sigma-70 family)